MPAGIGYTGRLARMAGKARPGRVAKTVGRSSGAFAAPSAAGRLATHLPSPMARSSRLAAPAASGRVGMRMAPRGHRGAQARRALLSKKGLAGMGIIGGGMALSRNTGRAMDRQNGRPTGVYQY